MVAASAGGVIAKDEAQVLFIVGILWAIAVAIAAFAYPVSYYRRKEHGIRQTGRQAHEDYRLSRAPERETGRGLRSYVFGQLI